MLLPVAKDIYLVEAPNKARFPYCHGLYIDDEINVLIDSSLGEENLASLKKKKVDILVNSHFHEDHILHNNYFTDAKIWAHALDAPAIRSMDVFLDFYGFTTYNALGLGQGFIDSIDLKASAVHHELQDGEIIDCGQTRLQVIHTPGHSPGHCCFWLEEQGILFSSDIDLSRFGPWYGHPCSNLGDYARSIKKCRDLQPGLVVSSHKGVISDDLNRRFDEYLAVIYRKEDAVLAALQKNPFNLEELTSRQIFYGPASKIDPFMLFFEKMAIKLHLEKLLAENRVREKEGLYYVS